ncbi:unnamed protein product [Adineta steineri]|uniref:Uncharacterized protein n=1 Tax=Adineta steineri TaxID=433720 RepID=A0A815KSS0_9BILA|nr:unnamed protein product [Adineta steineri]CAF1613792.1 unnamed protein product [Adineta steineri]
MSLPLYCIDKDAVLKDVSTDIKWRNGIPNYTKANSLFEKYKSTNHQPGSMISIIENIIKNWEKEVSHKTDPRQWTTVDLDNYRFSCNGQQKYSGWQMVKLGTYNALIGQTNYYDSNAITFEESHIAFKRSLGEGFAWEIVELYSGPPTITFTWKHFGRMTDYFSCPGLSGFVYKADPTNKMVKIYGMCKITVNENYQIQDLQVFYDPNQLFTQLTEICPFAPFMKLPNNNLTKNKANEKEQNNILPFSTNKNLKNEDYIKNSTNPQSKMCTIC